MRRIKKPLKLSSIKRKELADRLRQELGNGKVFDDEGTRSSYTGSTLTKKVMPDIIVAPQSVEDVQKTLKFANNNLIPVTTVSSGSQEGSTTPFWGGIVIDMMNMNKLIEIDTDRGYALIEPGVTLGELVKATAEVGYHVTVGSFPPGLSVIGNYTLTNVNTHRTSMIDDVVSMEVVLPDGTVVRTGSMAFSEYSDTVKWNSMYNSYPDLKNLFMNAYGTLGVITKAAIRIYRLGEVQPLHLYGFDDFKKANEFMKDLARGYLVKHVNTWHWVVYTLIDHLATYGHGGDFDLFLHDPWQPPDDRPYSIVVPTMGGYKEDMEGHYKVMNRLVKEHGGKEITKYVEETFPGLYKFYVDHYALHKADNVFMGGYGEGKPLFPIVVADPEKVSDLEKWVLKRLRDSVLRFGLTYYSHSMDQHRGVFIRFTPFVPYDSPEEDVKEAMENYNEVMEEALTKYGSVPLRNANFSSFEDPSVSPANKMGGFGHLFRLVKNAIDPHNIMNPGFGLILYGKEDEK